MAIFQSNRGCAEKLKLGSGSQEEKKDEECHGDCFPDSLVFSRP